MMKASTDLKRMLWTVLVPALVGVPSVREQTGAVEMGNFSAWMFP